MKKRIFHFTFLIIMFMIVIPVYADSQKAYIDASLGLKLRKNAGTRYGYQRRILLVLL